MEATLPPNEQDRLAALASYQILDTLPEQSYDDITRLASSICGAPIALITLIDKDRQWIKSRTGLDNTFTQTPRAVAFCAHTILEPREMLVVPDAQQDSRFADNPFVQGEPHVRFYAGAPLVTSDGLALGSLCVVDDTPRQLTPQQHDDLQALARQVMTQLELRRSLQELQTATTARLQAEQERHQSQALFQKLLERFPSGSVNVIDSDLRYLFASGKGLEEVGLSPATLVGKTHAELYPEEQVKFVEPFYRRVLAGEDVQFDLLLGSQCYTIYATPLHNDQGEIYALVAIAHNTTKRREEEQRLRESEERFRRIFEEGPLSMAQIAPEGSVIAANTQLCQMLGYTEQELKHLTPADITHPEDIGLNRELNRQIFAGEISSYQVEKRYLTKQGQVVWGSLTVSVIRDGEGRSLYALKSIENITQRKQYEDRLQEAKQELEKRVEERTTELQNRARQQEAVAELGQRAMSDVDMDSLLRVATALVSATLEVEFSSVLELLPGGNTLRYRGGSGWQDYMIGRLLPAGTDSQSGYALLLDAPLIVTDLRSETRFTPAQFFLESGVVSGITVIVGGYQQPFGTLAAHTIRSRTFTQDDVNFLQAVAHVLAVALERHQVESEMRALNTELSLTNESLRIENVEHQMTLGALRHIAQALQKSKEEADQANAAKSEFLSRMSHELRTPLNAILGFGQILDRQELTPLQSESVGHILKGGRHLLGLINEVLDISRVETGSAELSIEPVQLDEVVAEACALVQPLAHQSQIRMESSLVENSLLKNSLVPHTPLYGMADRQRLHQVLINLLSNAIKYNRSGGVVTISGQQVAGGRVQIRVQDSGWGLSAPELEKLFTPFERLHAVDSGIEGTGLGLVISQRLITAMGGTLGVESEVGVGSTFIIELPQAQVSAQDPNETLAKPLSSPAPKDAHPVARTFTVLSIEDNLSNMRLMETILESRPEITLLGAMQGSIGLDITRQHHPDLILLDLHLPGLSGSEVLGHLQGDEATRDIPVIVVSADATTQQIERLLAAGATAYLTKPLDVENFLSTLDQILLKSG